MSSRFLKSRVTSNSIYPRNSRRTPWMHLAQQQYLEESQIIFGLFQNSDGSSTTRYFFFTLPCLTNIRGCVPLVEIKLWTKTILILRRSWILPVFTARTTSVRGVANTVYNPCLSPYCTLQCEQHKHTNANTHANINSILHKHSLAKTHTLRIISGCCLSVYIVKCVYLSESV